MRIIKSGIDVNPPRDFLINKKVLPGKEEDPGSVAQRRSCAD
jgi:hypothetical protein